MAVDPNKHRRIVVGVCSLARKDQLEQEQDYLLDNRGSGKPVVKCRDKRAFVGGVWRAAYPSRLNSTILSGNE